MSEYWKSTPKYWCKHCKTYVRDTKLERTNHDATPKHQGNLKRFLRDLHREHENEERTKDRAKAEVARLNGIPLEGSGSSSGLGRGLTPSLPKPQATTAQRKQQMSQLAEMGISIPDEFRPDMAMAGEWQVTAERVIDSNAEKKPEALALGVRKREAVDDEDEELSRKRKWGSRYKSHPAVQEEDLDLDALLNTVTRKPKVEVQEEIKREVKQEVKDEPTDEVKLEPVEASVAEDDKSAVKIEAPEGGDAISADIPQSEATSTGAATGVVFKKRKAKNIRQK